MATTSRSEPAPARGRPDPGAAAARLAELFDAHAATVLGICRSLLRDVDEAEDAAQQTFLSAYRGLLGGTNPRDSGAWIATIARNECRTRIRSRMREPLMLAEVPAEAAPVEPIDVESLRRALAQLPRQQRKAFLLREFSGLSYAELAAALGVSQPAVESLLFRARRQLRGALASALSLPLSLRELLARLAGGSAAVKVAAATTGAAVIAGGTVALAPRRHATQPHRAARAAAPKAPARRQSVPRVAAPLVVSRVPQRVHPVVREQAKQEVERPEPAKGAERDHEPAEQAAPAENRRHGGETEHAATEPVGGSGGDQASTSVEPSDSGSSGDGGGSTREEPSSDSSGVD